MNLFPDTSFLCSVYRQQDNSERADAKLRSLKGPLTISSLLMLEFRQSVRLQIALYNQDRTRGYSREEGERTLAKFNNNLKIGALETASVEWVAVHTIAEQLSALHTISARHRLMDILHVATALHLQASEYLTFDANQKKLARAAGLRVTL